jgi:two-component system, OmpR family, phosphate regulon sensor histidine kinase PhoR
MINLLSNAVKFSNPQDKVLVKVKTKAKNDVVEVRISVQDFGLGIKDEEKSKIFQPYFRTGDKLSRQLNTNSHGLGLYIC